MKKKIITELIMVGIIVILINITFSNNLQCQEKSDFSKLTKITLLNESVLKVETVYKFIWEKDMPPILTIQSDTIFTEGELKNIKCLFNNISQKYKVKNLKNGPEWKYIAMTGEISAKRGEECKIYLSYDVNASDLYKIDDIYIGCQIGLHMPKTEKGTTYIYSFGVCSEMNNWQPFHPYTENIKFDATQNCEYYESSIIEILKDSGYLKIKDPVIFQKKGIINIVYWEQRFTIESNGNLIYEYWDTLDCPLSVLFYIVPLYYGGVDPSLEVKFILKNNEEKTSILYKTEELLKEKVINARGFGHVFVSSKDRDYLIIAANHPELEHCNIYFKSEYPNYQLFDEIEDFSYKLTYHPLFDISDPEANIIVKFILADNFYVEKYNQELIDFHENDSILEFHFISGEGPFNPIELKFSKNTKRIFDVTKFINLFLTIFFPIIQIIFLKKGDKNKFYDMFSNYFYPIFLLFFDFLILFIVEMNIMSFVIKSYFLFALISFLFSMTLLPKFWKIKN